MENRVLNSITGFRTYEYLSRHFKPSDICIQYTSDNQFDRSLSSSSQHHCNYPIIITNHYTYYYHHNIILIITTTNQHHITEGQIVERFLGYRTADELETEIKNALKKIQQ